ncbi:hypothetical protein KCU65_g217, partial [Aureobasidium melanogenum]
MPVSTSHLFFPRGMTANDSPGHPICRLCLHRAPLCGAHEFVAIENISRYLPLLVPVVIFDIEDFGFPREACKTRAGRSTASRDQTTIAYREEVYRCWMLDSMSVDASGVHISTVWTESDHLYCREEFFPASIWQRVLYCMIRQLFDILGCKISYNKVARLIVIDRLYAWAPMLLYTKSRTPAWNFLGHSRPPAEPSSRCRTREFKGRTLRLERADPLNSLEHEPEESIFLWGEGLFAMGCTVCSDWRRAGARADGTRSVEDGGICEFVRGAIGPEFLGKARCVTAHLLIVLRKARCVTAHPLIVMRFLESGLQFLHYRSKHFATKLWKVCSTVVRRVVR